MNPIDRIKLIKIQRCFERYSKIELNSDGSVDVYGETERNYVQAIILNLSNVRKEFNIVDTEFELPFVIRKCIGSVYIIRNFSDSFSLKTFRNFPEELDNLLVAVNCLSLEGLQKVDNDVQIISKNLYFKNNIDILNQYPELKIGNMLLIEHDIFKVDKFYFNIGKMWRKK
jgi:hypothetical protein